MTKQEKLYLEEILNEEIKTYLDSGNSLNDVYITTLRGLMAKFNLTEIYPYDMWYEESEN